MFVNFSGDEASDNRSLILFRLTESYCKYVIVQMFSDDVIGDNVLALQWCQIVATLVACAQFRYIYTPVLQNSSSSLIRAILKEEYFINSLKL